MSEFDHKLSAENLIAHFTANDKDEAVQDQPESESKSTSSEIQDPEKNINWHKLAHKLREHNRKLLKKVFQLEQEVIEANQSLSEQEKSLQSNNIYAAKQAEKINRHEEEISEFSQKIVGYEREIHSQKATIDSLIVKLETSQQKTNQLDQEFVNLRNLISEKDSELTNKTKTIKELQILLERQKYQFTQPQVEVTPEIRQVTIRANEPIRAWSAGYEEANIAKQTTTERQNCREEEEQVNSAIAKKHQPISSIAAVKLPQFSRHAE